MISRSVHVRVPASTANLGPGFDCLGMALQLYNEVELRVSPGSGLAITVSGSASTEDLPRNETNLVYRVISRIFELTGTPLERIELALTVNTPLARGVGSSAAAIVAGMLAANTIACTPLDNDALLREMVHAEGHPDNIVPCLVGGLTASLAHDGGVVYERYAPHPSVRCVLLIPDYQLSTSKARQALPKSVPMRDAIFNLARVPLVITALTSGKLDHLSVLMDDRIHQPYRKELVRDYDLVASEAEKAGAAAVCLSGAGPTMLAVVQEHNAHRVAKAMKAVLDAAGVGSNPIITCPEMLGAVVTRPVSSN